MTSLSIFTSMTQPEKRKDPWNESLSCYEDFADEVVTVGESWPKNLNGILLEKYSKKGLINLPKTGLLEWILIISSTKKIKIIKNSLNYSAISFPQYQIFTLTGTKLERICIAFNKKFPNIKLNGGGDLTLATLNDVLIIQKYLMYSNLPIRIKFSKQEIIAEDMLLELVQALWQLWRRGGESVEEAFDAWFRMIKERYAKHTFKINVENHPKYIKEKLANITENQFAYSAFGLKNSIKRYIII